MQKRKQNSNILNVRILAEELGITEEQACALMAQEGFPATEVSTRCYVVERSLLEKWVRRNSRWGSDIGELLGSE